MTFQYFILYFVCIQDRRRSLVMCLMAFVACHFGKSSTGFVETNEDFHYNHAQWLATQNPDGFECRNSRFANEVERCVGDGDSVGNSGFCHGCREESANAKPMKRSPTSIAFEERRAKRAKELSKE